jgi:rod shape-determining protein MreB
MAIARLFNRALSVFSSDIGIDLGTANTLIYVRGKGVVINEPTIVAINKKTGQLVAIGEAAKSMQGRTPGHIDVVRPLHEGVISDFEVTEEMLGYFINKVRQDTKAMFAPRVLIGVPCGITNVEMRAARDAAKNAGAREVYLIEEPMAAAIGAKLPISKSVGSMIIDIGGGTSNIAVISYGGMVASKNLKVAGDHLNNAIVFYIRDQFKVLVGERTAEEAKIKLAAVEGESEEREMIVRGRDVVTGLPKEVIVTDADIREAINPLVDSMVEAVRSVLEQTPPEVMSDIMQKGIYLSGGGALIPGLAPLLESIIRVPVIIVADPLRAVIRGIGVALENLTNYEPLLIDQHDEITPNLKN